MTKQIFETFARPFYTSQETAQILGVSLASVQNWASAGRLEYWKTEGGHRRITADSIQRHLMNRPAHKTMLRSTLNQPDKPRQIHILFLGRDHVNMRLLAARAAKWSIGPSVEIAEDGLEALIKIGMHCPDLIVTDLNIPHFDHVEILEKICAMPSCKEMKIVLIEANARLDLQADTTLPPAVICFQRPVPLKELEAIASDIANARTSR